MWIQHESMSHYAGRTLPESTAKQAPISPVDLSASCGVCIGDIDLLGLLFVC